MESRDNSRSLARKRWNWIAPGGRSRALPLECNHTCLPACDIIVMRVRALYTPFTAKCTVQSAGEARGRPGGRDVAPYARPHVDFPWHCASRNVRLYLAMCVSRVPACYRRDGFIHARACDVTRTILHARDLRHSVRCPNRHGRCETGRRPIYIQDPPVRHSVVVTARRLSFLKRNGVPTFSHFVLNSWFWLRMNYTENKVVVNLTKLV